MNEVDQIIEKNEKVLWQGQPVFLPFIATSAISGLFIGGLMTIFFTGILLSTVSATWWVALLPHFWLGPVILIGGFIYPWLVHRFTFYVITNRRIIFQKGVIGRDYDIVDHDQVTHASVDVGLFDKLMGNGSGTIMISSPSTVHMTKRGAQDVPFMMRNVPAPYEVFKFFKKVAYDVKTDVQFPNQYRPSQNPGYPTSYRVNRGSSKRTRN